MADLEFASINLHQITDICLFVCLLDLSFLFVVCLFLLLGKEFTLND